MEILRKILQQSIIYGKTVIYCQHYVHLNHVFVYKYLIFSYDFNNRTKI